MTDAMNKTMLELLPLRYEDGSDYCTVTDANGGNVALTVQPELIKAMEAALRAAAQPSAAVAAQAPQPGDGAREALKTIDRRLNQVQPGYGTRANDLVNELRPIIRAALASKD